MNDSDFWTLVFAHRLRGVKTITGCRMVLVEGLTAYKAAKAAKVSQSVLSKALRKLRAPVCPTCCKP